MIDPVVILAVGIAAAVASTISFVPQAIDIIRTRDVEALSPSHYALTVLGFALWTSYGLMRGDWALVAPNTICLALSVFILIMIAVPHRTRHRIADAIEEKTPISGKKSL
jgi:MtN3 and saliva related transmembrane protein